MIQFSTIIKKFGQQGEKTGWAYVEVPAELATQLKPGDKRSFRVKGFLDDRAIEHVSLVPIGGGDFILAVNANMRKKMGKNVGATIKVKIEIDDRDILPPAELIECLKDEPRAFENYNKLPKSHQHYYTRWIESAKTDATKAKRIAVSVTVLATGQSFSDAMKAIKADRETLLKP